MASRTIGTLSFLLVILPALVLSKALPDDEIREERGLDSLIGGGLGRDLSHTYTIRKMPRSRMDTLTGFGLGRSFDNDFYYPAWMTRPYVSTSDISKRNFDVIDSAGFGSFAKRNFDKLDRPGFGDFNKRDFGKRNFDQIDRPGFGAFSGRR